MDVSYPIKGIAVSPDGTKVYAVVNVGYPQNAAYVYVIDTTTNKVTPLFNLWDGPTTSSATGVAVSPDGNKIYIPFVTTFYDSKEYFVDVFDTTTNTIIKKIKFVGLDPLGIAINPDGTNLYVACTSGTFNVIDTTTNTVKTEIPWAVPSQAGHFIVGYVPAQPTIIWSNPANIIYDTAIPVLIINACKRRFNFFIFRNHFIYTDFFYLGSVGKVHDYPNFDSFFHRNKFNNST